MLIHNEIRLTTLAVLFAPWLVVFSVGMSDVSAEEADAEENVIYRQRTVYSFDGDTIDGDLLRPDGAYIEARKEVQHSNLIKVREDFRDKVLESVIHLW